MMTLFCEFFGQNISSYGESLSSKTSSIHFPAIQCVCLSKKHYIYFLGLGPRSLVCNPMHRKQDDQYQVSSLIVEHVACMPCSAQ